MLSVRLLLAAMAMTGDGGGGGAFASNIDIAVDEKKHWAHVVDSLDLLLYVCLLILTIVTVWGFKHRRVRFLHESGLAVAYGLAVGLLLRLMGSSGRPATHLPVRAHGDNGTLASTARMLGRRVAVEDGGAVDSPPDALVLHLNVTSRAAGGGNDYANGSSDVVEKVLTYGFEGELGRAGGGGLGDEDGDDIQAKATFNPEIFFYVLLPPIIFHAGYSMRRKQFFDNLGAILAYALIGTTVSTFVIAWIMYGFVQIISATVTVNFLDALYFGAIVSATDPVTVLAIFHVRLY